MRTVGTVVRGIRTPVIKEGDDLVSIVVESLLCASKAEKFTIKDKDIIGITEAVVAISEGNYVTVDQIAREIKEKYPSGEIGVLFPTPVSRNRFSLILKGIARGSKKIFMQMSYPNDEVGNSLFDEELIEKYNINPHTDVFNENQYNEMFGRSKHLFTGVDYIRYFKDLVEKEDCELVFIFANNPLEILKSTKNILVSSVHSRHKQKKMFKGKTDIIYGLDEILNTSIGGSGYNSKYGLLGSNKATDERLKLFPEHGYTLIENIQKDIFSITGKKVEVLVYGDGAFKDPIGHIWELADPVVSPFYTKGLIGTPHEIKLKYISDNKYDKLNGEELNKAIREEIKNKNKISADSQDSLGTTPRQLPDLIGSLCDLTSGSGDKGTPVVYIQGYFDSYAD